MPTGALHLSMNRNRRGAIQALEAMSDDDLGRRLQPYHVPWFPQNLTLWNPNEPEFDGNMLDLRAQALADIDVAYGYQIDTRCDERLAIGQEPSTGNRMLSYIVMPEHDYECSNCGESDCDCEDRDDPADGMSSNPVARLIALGVCYAPQPAIRVTPDLPVNGDFPAYRVSTAFPAYRVSTATTTGIGYTTGTASDFRYLIDRNEGEGPF